LDNLAPGIRRRCLHYLYRICSRRALLPRSLTIPLSYDPTESPSYHGGFADVWKGRHRGRDAAAKVLRTYSTSDLEQIKKVGCSRLAAFTNGVTGSNTEVLQGGRGMGGPSPSERTAAVRRHYVREPVRDGIGVDGEWEHQPICEDAYRRGSAGTRMSVLRSSPSLATDDDTVTEAQRRRQRADLYA